MGWKKGELDGERARVKEEGTRVEAVTTTGKIHDHVVANDGLNADYVREGTEVIVDNLHPDPYNPKPRGRAPAPATAPSPPPVVNPPC